MKEEKTISTHVSGDARARRHNKRDREVTDNEPHIDPYGYHETLIDESTVHAYHRLFDPAVEEYNARQTRADRKIKNYHAKVEADPRKHTCYEMTICVGSKDNPVDRDLGYTIMREYVDGWKDRNPNMELIGAYYHADEEGVPGWHLDFIPVAHGFKNGPSVQTALSRALVEQGFGYVKGRNEDGLRQTPQILWERSENDTLEAICNKYGVKVEHPERGKDVKHLATPDYKELQDEVHELESQVKQLNGELEGAKSEKLTMENTIKSMVKDVDFVLRADKMSPKEREAYDGFTPAGKADLLRQVVHDDASKMLQLEKDIPELESRNQTLESEYAQRSKANEELKNKNVNLETVVIPQNQQQAEKIISDATDQARTIKSKAETEKKTLEGDIKGLEQRKENLGTEIQDKLDKAESEAFETLQKASEQADKIIGEAYQVKYHTVQYPNLAAANYAINTGEVNGSDVYVIYPDSARKCPIPRFEDEYRQNITEDVESGKAMVCADVPEDKVIVPKTVCKEIVGCLDRMSSLPASVKTFTEEFKASDPDRNREDNSWSEPTSHGVR